MTLNLSSIAFGVVECHAGKAQCLIGSVRLHCVHFTLFSSLFVFFPKLGEWLSDSVID